MNMVLQCLVCLLSFRHTSEEGEIKCNNISEWLIDFQVQHGRKPSDGKLLKLLRLVLLSFLVVLSRQKNSKF